MYATEIVMPSEIFNFSSQSKLDTYSLDQLIPKLVGYDDMMVERIRLSIEAIRAHANEFPFWQRRRWTGRPPQFSQPKWRKSPLISRLNCKRWDAETAFSMITRLFGQRLRCRSERGRKNEVQAKLSMFNIFLLANMNVNSLG